MGAESALGAGLEAHLEALLAGRDGLRPVRRFDVEPFEARLAGLLPAWELQLPGESASFELAQRAAEEALKTARCVPGDVPPERVAVVLGTCFGEALTDFSGLTVRLAEALGFRGPRITLSTACASSTSAIGVGSELIEEGWADRVVAGGVDVLSREIFAGFHAIGALSEGKCAPFGETLGTSLSEGAGFVVLEPRARAEARGVTPWASVLGFATSADAHHETAPDPSGTGATRAILAALRDAGLAAGELDAVSAHATGTASNDRAEWLALQAALGARADAVPISALKSFLGHAQGASGSLELIAALLLARRGLVAPSLRSTPKRAPAPPDTVSEPLPRRHAVRRLLKLSAAFGGANAALVVGARAPDATHRPRRAVHVGGISAIGPHGLRLEALRDAARLGRRLVGAVPPFELNRIVRSAPSRDVDPSSRYCAAAAALALEDAGLVIRGVLRERTALYAATSRMPAASVAACRRSVDERGVRGIAGKAFSRMVLNAPAGVTAQWLSVKGPLQVLSAGRAGGLLAILRAAEHLASRDDADHAIAVAHDELSMAPAADEAEGACGVTLSTFAGGVRLDAWSLGGPDSLPQLVSGLTGARAELDGVIGCGANVLGALRGGTMEPARLPLGYVDVDQLPGGSESVVSAYAFALAVEALRKKEARRLLVVARDEALTCAAVLTVARGEDGR